MRPRTRRKEIGASHVQDNRDDHKTLDSGRDPHGCDGDDDRMRTPWRMVGGRLGSWVRPVSNMPPGWSVSGKTLLLAPWWCSTVRRTMWQSLLEL